MPTSNRFPENKNFLQSAKYQLVFDRAPHISFFCQSVPLPDISLTEIVRETPFSPTYHAGEKMVYSPLNITFLVDEDIMTWTEIHDWMRALTFPTDFKEYQKLQQAGTIPNKGSKATKYSDATMIIYTSKNNSNIKVRYYNCFPTSLSQITFSTQENADLVPIADTTLRYDYFDFIK